MYSRLIYLQKYTFSWIRKNFRRFYFERSINFANDTEGLLGSERILPEMLNGYPPEYACIMFPTLRSNPCPVVIIWVIIYDNTLNFATATFPTSEVVSW